MHCFVHPLTRVLTMSSLSLIKHFFCIYIKVVYEDIWMTFLLDGDFYGNHFSWLENPQVTPSNVQQKYFQYTFNNKLCYNFIYALPESQLFPSKVYQIYVFSILIVRLPICIMYLLIHYSHKTWIESIYIFLLSDHIK